MAQSRSHQFIFATACAALLAACGGEGGGESVGGSSDSVPAADDAPPEIAQRQDNFESIGDSFKAIRTQLEGEPDLAVIAAEATNMGEKAKAQATLFPEGTSVEAGYDTEALAAIWEKPDEFQEAAGNLVAATDTMVELANGGDAAAVAAHVRELGGTCKACHDNFRVDDD